MQITPDNLDGFVAQSDAFGGPNSPACNEYWSSFQYVSALKVDQDLDPYGDEYVQAQLSLYGEISGRNFNQTANEHTPLDVARHVAAVNPYDHADPSALGTHVERLSRAFRLAKLHRGAHLLDLGCGWGLSSEVGAYLGLRVTAVDINPLFVELVNQRALQGRRAISATVASFDDFTTSDRYDMVLFYECLHHALRPWEVIGKFAHLLVPSGKIVLTGEPIQAIWWKHWGLRHDPISIYCMRKFGWFESGWSLDFIRDVFRRSGMITHVDHTSDTEIGYTLIARKRTLDKIAAAEIADDWSSFGWLLDEQYLTFLGEGWLMPPPIPPGVTRLRLLLRNFRSNRSLTALIRIGQDTAFEGQLPPGDTVVDVPVTSDSPRIAFSGDIWCPDEEVHNGDRRFGVLGYFCSGSVPPNPTMSSDDNAGP